MPSSGSFAIVITTQAANASCIDGMQRALAVMVGRMRTSSTGLRHRPRSVGNAVSAAQTGSVGTSAYNAVAANARKSRSQCRSFRSSSASRRAERYSGNAARHGATTVNAWTHSSIRECQRWCGLTVDQRGAQQRRALDRMQYVTHAAIVLQLCLLPNKGNALHKCSSITAA